MLNKYKKEKVSPLKKDVLRRAGQSLDEKINETIDDKIMAPIITIIFSLMLTIIEWIRSYFELPYMPWVFTFMTVIISIYFTIKIIPTIKHVKDMKLGRNGERIVAESLEELRIMGYKIYNDIISDSFNVDHVIVGPAGVFTIETKTYRKQIGANAQISYDGNKIEINGAVYPKDPIKQAKGQMYWLEGFIRDKAKINIKVKPVVIFPGWYINQINNNVEVWVLNEKVLPTFLNNSPVVLNQDQINLISSHIESYNRNI